MSDIEDYINSLSDEDLDRIEAEVSDWDDLDMQIWMPVPVLINWPVALISEFSSLDAFAYRSGLRVDFVKKIINGYQPHDSLMKLFAVIRDSGVRS